MLVVVLVLFPTLCSTTPNAFVPDPSPKSHPLIPETGINLFLHQNKSVDCSTC